MFRCPCKLTLDDGDPKAQVAEDANARTHGGPQQAHREQANHNEQAKKACECHLTGTRYCHLQRDKQSWESTQS